MPTFTLYFDNNATTVAKSYVSKTILDKYKYFNVSGSVYEGYVYLDNDSSFQQCAAGKHLISDFNFSDKLGFGYKNGVITVVISQT